MSLRVLFVGAAFPRPDRETLAIWALWRIRALMHAGADVRVIVPTSFVPAMAARLEPGLAAWARCPSTYVWDDGQTPVTAEYPRWGVYQLGPARKFAWNFPDVFATLGWMTLGRRLARDARRDGYDVVYA